MARMSILARRSTRQRQTACPASSGSASAVAARLCDFALGTDTGGSVRAPASFCGIYGLRPTHGAAPLDLCMPLAPSFDSCGFFARNGATLRDVGRVLVEDGGEAANRPMLASDLFARLNPAAQAALAPVLAHLEALLGKPEPFTVYDSPIEPLYAAFRQLQSYEIYQIHGPWVERFEPKLGPAIAGRFAFARNVTDHDVVTARALRAQFAAKGGVLIAPVVPGPAPRLDADEASFEAFRHEAMVFLQPAGMAGLPHLVIPAGLMEDAPIGLSLIGSKGSDLALLELAARLNRGNWATRG
jgi:amidase